MVVVIDTPINDFISSSLSSAGQDQRFRFQVRSRPAQWRPLQKRPTGKKVTQLRPQSLRRREMLHGFPRGDKCEPQHEETSKHAQKGR
jgi:hypothetical protein